MKNFITFEGCEGVGKSTQIRYLKEYLQKTNQPALFTREPGGNEVGEKIREILLKEKMSALWKRIFRRRKNRAYQYRDIARP